MTKQQYKICKFILKHHKLSETTEKFDIDYLELQYKLGTGSLDFSDSNMDENTTIELTDSIIDEYEKYRDKNINSLVTRIVAIWGAITGTVALFVQIMQAYL